MSPREQAITLVMELRQTSRIYIDLALGLSLRQLHEDRLTREQAP